MLPDPEQYADLYRRVIFAFGDGDEAIRLQDPDKLSRLVVVLGLIVSMAAAAMQQR